MMLRIDNYRQVLSLCSFSKGLLTLCFNQAFMAVDGIGTVVSVLSGRVSNARIVIFVCNIRFYMPTMVCPPVNLTCR